MKERVRSVYDWGRRVAGTFLGHHCAIHAAGLTYFALLAVVPVLCCVLVASKACGVDNYAKTQINLRIDHMIDAFRNGQEDDIARIAAKDEDERQKKRIAAEEFALQARKVSNLLFDRVNHFDVGTLGWVGFCFLLWTVISSLGTVETSFNDILDVPKARPIWKRAYLYLFIMVVLPILATLTMSLPIMHAARSFIAATLGASCLTRWAGDAIVFVLDLSVFRFAMTFILLSYFFAFFFWLIPNCKVAFRSAFRGGMFTAFFFGLWLKICAVAQVGIAKSSALYGSFAFIPIVLAWLYMSWQIVLLGTCVVKDCERARQKVEELKG